MIHFCYFVDIKTGRDNFQIEMRSSQVLRRDSLHKFKMSTAKGCVIDRRLCSRDPSIGSPPFSRGRQRESQLLLPTDFSARAAREVTHVREEAPGAFQLPTLALYLSNPLNTPLPSLPLLLPKSTRRPMGIEFVPSTSTTTSQTVWEQDGNAATDGRQTQTSTQESCEAVAVNRILGE